jgi:predicted ABC-type transport system involved in lysophospholipase L1 biosynthesis ATPase subunit
LLLDGTDVWTLSETSLARFRCRKVGFIFQSPSLLSNLSAIDNVAAPALLGCRQHTGERTSCLIVSVWQIVPKPIRTACRAAAPSGSHRPSAGQFTAQLLADKPTGDLDEEIRAVLAVQEMLGR